MGLIQKKLAATLLAFLMTFSSLGNVNPGGANAKERGGTPKRNEFVATATDADSATSGDALQEGEQLTIDKKAIEKEEGTGAEADGRYFLEDEERIRNINNASEDDFYDINEYLNTHRINVDGREYDHVQKLNPSKSFSLYLDFALSRIDLKDHGLNYKYKLPEHITIGDIGSEDDQEDLRNTNGKIIGSYYVKDDIIYITFPGYYDNVVAFFTLKADWDDVDNLASVPIKWKDGDETILFDLSQLHISKSLTSFVEQANGDSLAEFTVIMRADKENYEINNITFSDKYTSTYIKLYKGGYKDSQNASKDIKVSAYSQDGSRISEKYYNYSDVGANAGANSAEMTIDNISIPKDGYVEIKYEVVVDKKTALTSDATGLLPGYVNNAKGKYVIYDKNGSPLTDAESEVEVEGMFSPRTDWIYKTKEDAFKSDDEENVLVPYTIGINRSRLYSLGGSIVRDEITNYEEGGTVKYDMTQAPYVSSDDGTNETEKTLEWVVLDEDVFNKLRSNLYRGSEKTAMENILNGTSADLTDLRNKLKTKLGVANLTNENVSSKLFTSENANDFLWISPLDEKPTFHLLHYYTTASITDMGSKNSARMWYTEIEGYPRGPGIGWMNPYKKVLEVDKENYGIYEDGEGNYYVDWHISVTVPKNSHFDHIILSDDLPEKWVSDSEVSDVKNTGYYADWFPDAPFVSYDRIQNSNQSVEETAEYEWEISDQLFTISSESADEDVQKVVENLKGVFGDSLDTNDNRKYAITNNNPTWETAYFSHFSSYQGKTYVAPNTFMQGSYFSFLYTTGRSYRGQYLGDHNYRGYNDTFYADHYTWTPTNLRFYIEELPKKSEDYTIDINYRTQINPELIKALPDYCATSGKEFFENINYVKAYQGVYDKAKGGYYYDQNKEIARASASYYIGKHDVEANILKKITNYDKDNKTADYLVEINPNGSMNAESAEYELKDKIAYSGVKFNPTSIILMDDSGSKPGVDGKVIWSNNGSPDSEYSGSDSFISIDVDNQDNGSSTVLMNFDNRTGFFGESGQKFKHMYLVYRIDVSGWNPQDILSNAVYLYNEKNVPGTETISKDFLGSDTVEFVESDAITKKIVNDAKEENNFTPTFEIIVDTLSPDAGNIFNINAGDKFTINDVMSDNLTLEADTVKVQSFNTTQKSWEDMDKGDYKITYDEDNRELNIKVTVKNTATKYKVNYDAIVKPNKNVQVIRNTAKILEDENVKVNFESRVFTNSYQSGADAEAFKIKLKKYDADEPTKFLSASFKLYYYDSKGMEWKERTNASSSDGLFTTDPDDGTLTMSNAMCGDDPIPVIADKTWYKLEEVKAPDGYTLKTTPIYYYTSVQGIDPTVSGSPNDININKDKYSIIKIGGTATPTLSISNSKLQFDIKKVDASSDDVTVQGAAFALYSDEACKEKIADSEEVEPGVNRFSDIEISEKMTLYMKETKAPVDYQIDTAVYKVNIEGSLISSITSLDGQKTLAFDNSDNTYMFKNASSNGNLVIAKLIEFDVGSISDYADNEFRFTAMITDENGNIFHDGNDEKAFDAILTDAKGTKTKSKYYSGDVIYLKADETYAITGIPDKANYKVTEIGDDGFKTERRITDSDDVDSDIRRRGNVASGTITAAETDTVTYINTPYGSIEITKKMVLSENPEETMDIPDGLTLKVTDNFDEDDSRVDVYAIAVWDAALGKFVASETRNGITFDNSIKNGFKIGNVPTGKYKIYETNEDIEGFKCKISTNKSADSINGNMISVSDSVRSGGTRTTKVINTYSAAMDVDISAGKRVSGHNIKAGDYTFLLYDASNDTVVQSVKNGNFGSIKFNTLKFEQLGSYDYYIKEQIPEEATKLDDGSGRYIYNGTIYDNSVIDVNIVLKIGADNKLEKEVTYKKNGTVLTDQNDVSFSNIYVAEGRLSLEGTKELVGRSMSDGDYTFLADIKKVDSEGVESTVATGVKVGTSKADGTIDFDGTYTSGTETGDYFSYSEKDAGSKYIYDIYEKIPAATDADYKAGVTYSDQHFIVEATISDNRDGSLSIGKSIEDGNGKTAYEIAFVNKFNAEGNLKLTADKILTGKNLTADEYTFGVYEGSDIVATGKNDANGNIEFSDIRFYVDNTGNTPVSNLGNHTYTVKEIIPDGAELKNNKYTYQGVVYDSTSYTVRVNASANDDGTISFDVTGADKVENAKDTYKVTKNSGRQAAFVNTYQAYGTVSLSGKKTMLGRNFIDENDCIVIASYYELNSDSTLTPLALDQQVGVLNSDGTITFQSVTLNESSVGHNYLVTIKEYKPSDFGAVDRAGVTYSNEIYYLYLSPEDNGDGTLNLNERMVNSSNEEVSSVDFTNKYNAEGSLTFTATKLLKGRDIDNEQFTFDIYEGEKIISSGKNDENGNITFDEIKFYIDGEESYKGEHNYVIKERIPDPVPKGYVYDNSTYSISVNATDNGFGILEIVASGAAIDDSGLIYKVTLPEGRDANFINEYSAYGEVSLEGSKVLNGRELYDDEFSFKAVEYKVVDGKNTATGRVFTGTNNASGNIAFENITFSKDAESGDMTGVYHYEISEVKPEDRSLGGVTYDEAVYTLDAIVSDSGDGTLSVLKTIRDKDGIITDDIVFTNKYTSEANFRLEVGKELKGRDIEEGQFEFVILEGDNIVSTGTNDADGNVVFDDIRFFVDDNDSYIGTHNYTVKEVIPDPVPEGYKYDDATYNITVEAVDNEDGTITLDVTGAEKNDTSYRLTKDEEGADFVNKYSAEGKITLEASKILEGADLKADEFSFRLESVDEGNDYTDESTCDASGNVKFNAIHFEKNEEKDETGTYKYKLSEVIPEDAGLVPGVEYDKAVYYVTLQVEDAGNGKLNVTAAITDENEKGVENVVFKNIYSASAEVSFEGVKSVKFIDLDLKKRQILENEYTFTLEEYVDGEYKSLSETGTDKEGRFEFPAVNYDLESAGTHYYRISEVKGDVAYVQYTAEPVYVIVDVYDNGDSTMSTTVEYVKADSIEDVIKGKGENIDQALFENVINETTVKKVDDDNNLLEGAYLYIVDDNGEVVYSYTSGKSEVRIYGLERSRIYTLKEDKAPDGYEKAEDIKFAVGEYGKVLVYNGDKVVEADELVMVDHKVKTAVDSAKTGDSTNLLLMFMLMITSFGGIVLISRRKKNDRK